MALILETLQLTNRLLIVWICFIVIFLVYVFGFYLTADKISSTYLYPVGEYYSL
jgi:beta-lactamase regulating signal transducer with metallopeptidase domain